MVPDDLRTTTTMHAGLSNFRNYILDYNFICTLPILSIQFSGGSASSLRSSIMDQQHLWISNFHILCQPLVCLLKLCLFLWPFTLTFQKVVSAHFTHDQIFTSQRLSVFNQEHINATATSLIKVYQWFAPLNVWQFNYQLFFLSKFVLVFCFFNLYY